MQENNTNNPVPAPTVVPSNGQQPKTNSFLVILLSVLLFVSVLIAGFFAYQTQKLVNELTLLRSESTPIVTTELHSDPTADWKIYENLKYGLSFKYPDNFTMEVNQVDTSNYVQLIFNKGFSDSFTIKSSTKYPVSQPKYLLDVESTGTKSLNNQVWNTYVLTTDLGLQLEKNNILYSVIYPSLQTREVDQIISTFAFTSNQSAKYTIQEIGDACISLRNSSKYWNTKYKECLGAGEDKKYLQEFCTKYNGNFISNGDSCRHSIEDGLPACGPESVFYCSFN